MKQLTQKLKNGEMDILEVSTPYLSAGSVLIRVHYSLVSAGTEGSTVSTARKSLIGKAKERPQQAKLVLDTLKQQGPVQTYRAVMKKLDSYSPLGYSAAGEVIAVGSEVKGFSIGDYVACAGAGYANHAEIVAVPSNLCVRLPSSADLSRAAYNTLGAIALQGVRQAGLGVGETVVVIGLGLLGQLSCLILRASGVRVVGLDIDQNMVDIAGKHCADISLMSSSAGVVQAVEEFTDGVGSDAVIITAATSSTDPINLAGQLLRKCGTVVVVGDVPTGFNREPDYYRKELILKMSCSYGPGRYDLNYEEKGIDYPVGYVRWTEKRNMNAFQELVHNGKINLDYLTTHSFKLDNALSAYDLIVDRKEQFLGILIEYDVKKPLPKTSIRFSIEDTDQPVIDRLGVAFMGAGSYAMSNLLPNVAKYDKAFLTGVLTSSGTSSRTVAEKYGFRFVTSDEGEILGDKSTNTVFIATRHDSHALYVLQAINAGKNVFVEKPLCLYEEELVQIEEALLSSEHMPALMVGFNRRFAPLAEIMKQRLGDGPKSMIYRVNAGAIPMDSWIQDKDIGGGRIIGEVCHFIDFAMYICGALPKNVYAVPIHDPHNAHDTVNICLQFDNGSIATISYFANGSKSLFKEYIEVYRAGMTAVLTDFRSLEIYGKGKPFRKKLLNQNKGQDIMVRSFLDAVSGTDRLPISIEEAIAATRTTFRVLDSIRDKQVIEI